MRWFGIIKRNLARGFSSTFLVLVCNFINTYILWSKSKGNALFWRKTGVLGKLQPILFLKPSSNHLPWALPALCCSWYLQYIKSPASNRGQQWAFDLMAFLGLWVTLEDISPPLALHPHGRGKSSFLTIVASEQRKCVGFLLGNQHGLCPSQFPPQLPWRGRMPATRCPCCRAATSCGGQEEGRSHGGWWFPPSPAFCLAKALPDTWC